MPRKPTAEESALFRQAIADIKPLNKTRAPHPQRYYGDKNRLRPNNAEKFDLDSDYRQRYHLNEYLEPVRGETYLLYQQNLPQKTLRKLRQGQYNAEAILDLHGYTVNEAAQALEDLLTYCLDTGKRVLRVVHGKGPSAILKTQINTWLQDTPEILAFCSARPQDGGTGALYILLKKQTASEDEDYDSE